MTKKVLIQLFFASVVFLIILIGSVYVNYPGILHPEAELRIPSYLANRPLLTKIFESMPMILRGIRHGK